MKKKIVFILPTLNAGGAERVLSFIAQNINKDKYESTLLIVSDNKKTAYEVSDIPVIFLGKKRLLYAFPLLFKKIFEIKPQVVLSSIGHLNTALGLISPFFPNTKFIIREASVISVIGKFSSNKKNYLRFLSKVAYKWIDGVICQSNDMAMDFRSIFKVSKEKITIINNPITQTTIPRLKSSDECEYQYITIGRLSPEKGHLRILDTLAKLKHDYKYLIIGDGPCKNEVFNHAEKLKLNSKIEHIAHTTDVFKYLRKSALFLQGSYVEGFPNAILESCLVGTPVLAYDVPGGTKEIVTHMKNGFLVSSEEQFLKYLQNEILIPPIEVRKSVMKKFDKDVIIHKYENLIEEIS